MKKEMENFKGIICGLCSNTPNKENFTVIDESTKDILKTVSLSLDFPNNYNHMMCSTCSGKLYSAFDFKSTCLYVEDKLVCYVNPKMSFVDLREVYLNEQNNKPAIKMEDDQKICRLCLQLVGEGFMPFYEVKLEMVYRYIPEVNFGLTEDPVVCRQCFDSLSVHDTFIKTCLDVEMKIQYTDGNKIAEIGYNHIYIKYEIDEVELKGRSVKSEEGQTSEETQIEPEEVDIKCEENVSESNPPSYDNATFDNKIRVTYEDVEEIKNEYMLKRETGEVQTNRGEEASSYNSEWENNGLKQEVAPELIQSKKNFKCHQLSKGPSGVRIHKCNTCDYETKFKSRLNVHELSHKDPSELQMYKCDACGFESKRRGHLKMHQLKHKDSSEIQMYKCDTCTFETRFKNNLKSHQLKHKDTSEIQMYKCDSCAYETKHKHRLKYHQITHKDPSETHMYTCDNCSFKTKYKQRLKAHQLTHKDPSEIQMWKCDTCCFETKYKGDLKLHELMHKDSSEIKMYKCDTCTYETMYKGRIKTHRLKHKDPSEVQMYKCDICKYETKYKKGLKTHRLIHKNSIAELSAYKPSDVRVFKCNDCDFQTRYKDSLRVHMLKHQDPSRVPTYDCDKCVFQTRHKQSLIRHQLSHKNSGVIISAND